MEIVEYKHIEDHVGARSRMCHRIPRRALANSIKVLMTAVTQQHASAVIEADNVMFQLCSPGDMMLGATRNSCMEFAISYGISGTT